MDVKITDYGQGEVNFVEYSVYNLSQGQLQGLNENLEEESKIAGDVLVIKMYFEDELYPFQSDVSKNESLIIEIIFILPFFLLILIIIM